jgi:surface protein
MCHYTRAALQPHEALQSILPPYNSNCAKLHTSMMTRDEQSTICLRVPAVFNGATAFNADIGKWNVASVSNMWATLRSLTLDKSSGT